MEQAGNVETSSTKNGPPHAAHAVRVTQALLPFASKSIPNTVPTTPVNRTPCCSAVSLKNEFRSRATEAHGKKVHVHTFRGLADSERPAQSGNLFHATALRRPSPAGKPTKDVDSNLSPRVPSARERNALLRATGRTTRFSIHGALRAGGVMISCSGYF